MNKKKTSENKSVSLNILSKPSALAVDGNSLSMNTSNNGELMFFQVQNKTDKTLDVNGVATLRLTLEQLEKLRDLLIQAIETHKSKMKELEGKTPPKQ